MKLEIKKAVKHGEKCLCFALDGNQEVSYLISRVLTGTTGEHSSGVLTSSTVAMPLLFRVEKHCRTFEWPAIDFYNDSETAIRILLMERIMDVRKWVAGLDRTETICIEIPDIEE